jgi:putative NADPH-quinone reductase
MRNGIDVGILNYCGLDVLEHKWMTGIHHASDETREQYLADIRKSVMLASNGKEIAGNT